MKQSRLFEDEIGPGVIQSGVQQTRVLQEYQRYKPRAANYVSTLSLFCQIFQILYFFNTRLEHSRTNLVFEMRHGIIFEMLY